MSGTIENTNNIIRNKISSLETLIGLFKNCKCHVDKNILDELNYLSEEYELGSIKILTDYFLITKK